MLNFKDFAEPITINHFSHPHPLKLVVNHQQQQQQEQNLGLSSCSGCKLSTAMGDLLYYCCNSCNYFLHVTCSKMPQKISHPFHKDHVFCLLTKPLHPDGYFDCDACGKRGDGFSYHCRVCSIDIHILCAAMPLSFTHQSHSHHLLNLTFSPPYPDKRFNCDVCNTSGSNHWLYRCHPCGFDVHLNCKNIPASFGAVPSQIQSPNSIPIPQANYPQMGSSSSQPQPQLFGSTMQHPAAATGVPFTNLLPNMGQMNPGFQGPAVMPFGSRQNSDHLLLQSLANSQQNMSINQKINYMQALLAAVGGAGAGATPTPTPTPTPTLAGGLGGVQHILQTLSGLNGGNNIPAGLGGNQNILQSLMSGGFGGAGAGAGAGVLDILQSIMGAGSGLDFLGGLGF